MAAACSHVFYLSIIEEYSQQKAARRRERRQPKLILHYDAISEHETNFRRCAFEVGAIRIDRMSEREAERRLGVSVGAGAEAELEARPVPEAQATVGCIHVLLQNRQHHVRFRLVPIVAEWTLGCYT